MGVVFLTRPIYRAEARLRLGEPPPLAGVAPGTGILSVFGFRADPFASDLELMASRTVAEGVVRDAALHVWVQAPRGWFRDSLFVVLEAVEGPRGGRGATGGEAGSLFMVPQAGASTGKAKYVVEWAADGTVQVRRTSPGDSVVGQVAPGEALAFGGVRVAFRAWRPGMPRQVRMRTAPFGEAVAVTAKRIRIERTRRDANVVQISFDHGDPGVARTAVASVVARFMALRAGLQRRESGTTVDSLRAVAEQTRRELAEAERELEAVQRASRLVAPEPQLEVLVEAQGEVVGELERVQGERVAVEQVLARAAGAPGRIEAWSELAAHPAFLENAMVGELLKRLTELEAQRRTLALRRTEASREYRVLAEQLAYLDSTLFALVRSYRDALAGQVARLEARRVGLDARLAAAPAPAVELGRRQRAVRLLSEVLVATEQRLRQEELRQALTFGNVQVVDPPALRYKPVWPRKTLGLGAGVLLACVFALSAMVVQERADRSVRGAWDVVAAIGVPVLTAAVRGRDGAIQLAPGEGAAFVRHLTGDGRRARRLVLAPVGGEAVAGALALALAGALAEKRRNGGGEAPEVTVAPRADRFGVAVEVAARGGPVALVVEQARTRRDELVRSAGWLSEAGARVAGAVLVCRDARAAARAWD